ncbi:hypothetical protein LBMAG33_0720 [Candidatus Levyibacteriota bacterium]|nr:hypothetical protein LBMAG33_0720 [Candidatus Levybacteria bacterium]
MKKWNILTMDIQSIDTIQSTLLKNRGIFLEKDIADFLYPKLESVSLEGVGIDIKQMKKAIDRIKIAIEQKDQVIVFGDYDVDGICGAAIIWESLYKLGVNILPYIPHRLEEGYGLSINGIKKLQEKYKKIDLIITVDNGIVAYKAVQFAKEQGIDVIITDHHVAHSEISEEEMPAYAIIHSTKLCGASVGWIFSQEAIFSLGKKENSYNKTFHLELVALATVADLVPLTGLNRVLLKFGLEYLCKTKRLGLISLYREAMINPSKIGVYEIGHLIAPRINAMGRMESAMESLRLLCTVDKKRADDLTQILCQTNKDRQLLTQELWLNAKEKMKTHSGKKLIFIYDKSYQPGVIGLVAGKLVEEFYRPAIVLAVGDDFSKASARSVAGFNIIEFIRTASELLVDAGGHPMAAGFTVETSKLAKLQAILENSAENKLTEDLLMRTIKVDCEIYFSSITKNFYKQIMTLAPFGMGNPEPSFVSRDIIIDNMRLIGKEGKHLKLTLSQIDIKNSAKTIIEAIAFGFGEISKEFKIGDTVDIAYAISENTWNGIDKLQIKLKDIKIK